MIDGEPRSLPFERFYEPTGRGLALRSGGLGATGRTTLPGDVPARAARLRAARARRHLVPGCSRSRQSRSSTRLRRSADRRAAVEPAERGRAAAYEELAPLTDGLPPKERAAVVLRYGYDLDYDAIGAALGSSSGGGAPGRLLGCAAAAEGESHDSLQRPRRALPRGRCRGRRLDVGVRRLRHAGRPAAPRRVRARPLPHRLRPRAGGDSTAGAARRPRVLRVAARRRPRCTRELDEYFEGRRQAFDLEFDLRATPEFHRRVLAELNRVEYGAARRRTARLRPGRRSARGARGRHGDEPEPAADRPPLPPCRGRERQPDGLRRRARPQGVAAAARGSAALATVRRGAIIAA